MYKRTKYLDWITKISLFNIRFLNNEHVYLSTWLLMSEELYNVLVNYMSLIGRPNESTNSRSKRRNWNRFS